MLPCASPRTLPLASIENEKLAWNASLMRVNAQGNDGPVISFL